MPMRAPALEHRTRRTISSRRRAIVLVAAALVLLPVTADLWTVRRARHAMVAAVEKAELTAARAAAIDTAANLQTAMNYADSAARRPGLAARIKAHDRLGTIGALDGLGAVN